MRKNILIKQKGFLPRGVFHMQVTIRKTFYTTFAKVLNGDGNVGGGGGGDHQLKDLSKYTFTTKQT